MSIYHGCSTLKKFWGGKFVPVNMKNCGRCNVSKHSGINNREKYTTLDISLDFGIINKMKITSSEPKEY